MPHSTDIVAYTFQADLACEDCVVSAVLAIYNGGWPLAGLGSLDTERTLSELAIDLELDYDDPYSYDSDDYPKPVFRDQLEYHYELCGTCYEYLS